jgi:AmmeMemoRadiSam system protein A
MQKMAKTHHALVELARKAVEKYVLQGRIFRPRKLTPEMRQRAGVFVSLKKHGGLRGCIGTFSPTMANVAEEIVTNAISSATRDPRFMPVQPSELHDLEYSVDVLSEPEPVSGVGELDPRKYGVIVECGFRRGLLLPDLEGVDKVQEQIEICRAKAGIAADEPIELYRFRVQRFV